ncbi:GNAT family N-acetyltransferase [Actinoplanes derwentensis]|uniref:Phosphinothricin acetyltransferase n=1 Tax=Actinoplanes derwentensis TaxID=113562 RepID=A0A1H1TMJ7_9ACTN|nr:GNAT family N-acetyltransferase [Actinoplanes derwentensis]GID85076.1 N-acetyltransferase [Actinoplanes derwentensis]SDS61382.1 phosphinothricin acetyltransferase [Actinoplanes derwentensis]
MRIMAMTDEHAVRVLEIYRLGIEGGHATFETATPDWERFVASRPAAHRFVAVDESPGDENAGTVLGWVACGRVSDREVYAGVVEHSVYLDPAARGRGIGKALLGALIESTEAAGIWTVQSGIFPENTASLALHAACGFRTVGIRERVGRHHGVWRDVVLVERRSLTVI